MVEKWEKKPVDRKVELLAALRVVGLAEMKVSVSVELKADCWAVSLEYQPADSLVDQWEHQMAFSWAEMTVEELVTQMVG